MRFHGFRIHVALFIFLVILALGLGVQYLHQKTQVIDPLVHQLQEVPGVSRVDLEAAMFSRRSRTMVTLQVERGIPLSLVFDRVHQSLLAAGGDYVLKLEDSPNALLLSLFQRIQITVEEAVITGEFTALERRVKSLAEAQGVTWELGVDRHFIYLSLSQGQNALKRVISRGANEGTVIVVTDGGVDNWENG